MPGNNRPRKGLTRKRAAQLRTLRRWARAWKETPETMEAHRQKATNAAQAKRRAKHDALVALVATLPARITTERLREFIAQEYPKTRNPKSCLNRLTRHRLIAYDYALGLWLNLCPLNPGKELN